MSTDATLRAQHRAELERHEVVFACLRCGFEERFSTPEDGCSECGFHTEVD